MENAVAERHAQHSRQARTRAEVLYREVFARSDDDSPNMDILALQHAETVVRGLSSGSRTAAARGAASSLNGWGYGLDPYAAAP